jgi:LmbE family N-acetylglucosaminyl deacetylase
MHALSLPPGTPLRVLVVGAHADDIEIGCGGTLLTLLTERPVDVTWVVLSAAGARADEARASADVFLTAASAVSVAVDRFTDGFFPAEIAEVKRRFEELKLEVDPDLVLTHAADDAHQDHRVVNELTWNTFRDHLVLEYEIPKVDGDIGRPSVYVPIEREIAERKVALLRECFPSQARKHWFDPELFMGLMRLRGMECVSASGLAEAFRARKLVLAVGPAESAA